MNAIVGFRKCTLTNEELAKKVDEMTDKIYQDWMIPTRQVPARPNDDYDLLVGELILRFLEIKRNIKQMEQNNKKLYYQLSDNADVCDIVMELSGAMEWIKQDESEVTTDDDPRQYTLTPIWLTDEEFKNLPEANF